MDNIRVAIAGIGNCASSLIQGIEYYRTRNTSQWQGLMHESIGGWRASDIEVVTAFDIDRRKVGHQLEVAVFAKPKLRPGVSIRPATKRGDRSDGTGARRGRRPHGALW